LRDLIRKAAAAFRERAVQADRFGRRCRCLFRLPFNGLASGLTTRQQAAERKGDPASRARRSPQACRRARTPPAQPSP
jgi:hypothetical protein